MAAHARFTVVTGVQVYFCDPKSAWQRGSNENTNGLLRQYLPKRIDFRSLTQADPTWTPSPPSSTTALDRPSDTGHHHKHWPRCCVDRLNPQA
jgi:hypothetical protein